MGKPERKHFKKWTSPYILKGQALFQKSKTTVDLQTKRAERDQREIFCASLYTTIENKFFLCFLIEVNEHRSKKVIFLPYI